MKQEKTSSSKSPVRKIVQAKVVVVLVGLVLAVVGWYMWSSGNKPQNKTDNNPQASNTANLAADAPQEVKDRFAELEQLIADIDKQPKSQRAGIYTEAASLAVMLKPEKAADYAREALKGYDSSNKNKEAVYIRESLQKIVKDAKNKP